MTSKGRAQEKVMHIESKSMARWLNVAAKRWPAASTPRVFTVPMGREDKEMTIAEQMGRLQGILDICEDIPKNLAITEQSQKAYLKEIAVRNPDFFTIYKDDLAAVKAALNALKQKSASKPKKEAKTNAEA